MAKWRQEAAERKKLEAEEAQQKQVTTDIERWRLARDVREFISHIKGLVAATDLTIEKYGNLDCYIRAAEAMAECVDPLRGLRADSRALRRREASPRLAN